MPGVVNITEATNLAVHAMAYLGGLKQGEAATAQQIADDLGVSRDHLGKVFQRLVRMGLVSSKRGPKGGFTLIRPASKVTLLEVVEAVDGPLQEEGCLMGKQLCGTGCILSGLVKSIHNQVYKVLASTPLSSLPPLP